MLRAKQTRPDTSAGALKEEAGLTNDFIGSVQHWRILVSMKQSVQ